MRKFTLNAHPDVAPGKRDFWFLFASAGELADNVVRNHVHDSGFWIGGTYEQCKQWAHTGRLEDVGMSDQYLRDFESLVVLSTKHATINDVVGSIPNVPAYIAGHPAAMRRRVRCQTEDAPLTIVVDVGVSASVSQEAIAKRAAAILALVRMIANIRPVELWAGGAGGKANGDTNFVFARVDTAPLDLARAAFVLGHSGFSRGLELQFETQNGAPKNGPWPYKNIGPLSPENWTKVISQAFPGDLLAIPGLGRRDQFFDDPRAWFRRTLADLGIGVEQ